MCQLILQYDRFYFIEKGLVFHDLTFSVSLLYYRV
jgi:hypothetical protein